MRPCGLVLFHQWLGLSAHRPVWHKGLWLFGGRWQPWGQWKPVSWRLPWSLRSVGRGGRGDNDWASLWDCGNNWKFLSSSCSLVHCCLFGWVCSAPFFPSRTTAGELLMLSCPGNVPTVCCWLGPGPASTGHKSARWEEMACSTYSLASHLPEAPPAVNWLWLLLKLQSHSPTGWVSLSKARRPQDAFWSWREMLWSLLFSWLLWDRVIYIIQNFLLCLFNLLWLQYHILLGFCLQMGFNDGI